MCFAILVSRKRAIIGSASLSSQVAQYDSWSEHNRAVAFVLTILFVEYELSVCLFWTNGEETVLALLSFSQLLCYSLSQFIFYNEFEMSLDSNNF